MNLWEIMRQLDVTAFLESIQILHRAGISDYQGEQMPDDVVVLAHPVFSQLQQLSEEFGLVASTITVEKILYLLSERDRPSEKFKKLVKELEGRVIDEMSVLCHLSLTEQEAEHYNQWQKGWEDIVARFL